MNRLHLTLRARLMLWYMTTLLVLLGSASLAVYYFVKDGWERSIHSQMDLDLMTVRSFLKMGLKGEGKRGHLAGDIMFVVWENDKVVFHSAGLCRTGFLGQYSSEEETSRNGIWRSKRGELLILKNSPVEIIGHSYIVTVAADSTPMNDTLGQLGRILMGTTAAGVLLAALGGYFMAGRALAPLGRMAAKAREISADNLSERLPVENAGDEMGRMAVVFNQTLGRLQNSFNQLRSFTADVSHELRTPLTAIRSVGEVALEQELEPARYRDVIGSMLEETGRLAGMIDSLLILARAESGRIPLQPASRELNSIIQSVVELLRPLAEEKQQQLTTQLLSTARYRLDAQVLRMALINVVDNAIRYTPEGGSVIVRLTLVEGSRALIEVIDEAPRLAPEERERVFERFYRVEKSRSTLTGGNGLGLAIAKWSIEANGGIIEFRDGDRGNRCCISFPLDP